LSADAPARLKTRLPADGQTANLALCRPAIDSMPGAEPAQAANDGSDAIVWIASRPGQSLTIDLGRAVALDAVTVTRPPVLARPGKSMFGAALALPVVVAPSDTAGEDVEISADARNWTRIARVVAPGARDVLPANGQTARYLRLSAPDASSDRPLAIGDVAATERH